MSMARRIFLKGKENCCRTLKTERIATYFSGFFNSSVIVVKLDLNYIYFL